MSARASAYAKTLTVCPNGETITPREKLVLIVLADAHQDKARHFTYPAVDTLAEDAMCDRRSCQRYLAALERKGVIKRMRPQHQGRGMQVFYFFTALDAVPEGWQPAALFDPPVLSQRAAKGRQKGDRRAADQPPALLERAQELELEPEQKPEHPPTPSQASGSEFGTEQLAHLARCRERGEDTATWERYYREENARHAETAAAETRLRAEFPDSKAAVAEVMKQCGFVEGVRRNPLPHVLYQVMAAQELLGAPPWVTGPRMIEAWQRRKGLPYGALKFFRDGHWLEVLG